MGLIFTHIMARIKISLTHTMMYEKKKLTANANTESTANIRIPVSIPAEESLHLI